MEIKYNFEIVGDILSKSEVEEYRDICNSETEEELKRRCKEFLDKQWEKIPRSEIVDSLFKMFGSKLTEELGFKLNE